MIGLATASAAYAADEYIVRAFAAVERDITDKLRRLHISARSVRKYLIAWLVVIGLTFAGFWILTGGVVLAVMAVAFMASAPWYLLRRMAQRHHQRIEDQLA